MIVYQIKNKVNGKKYVGMTTKTLSERLRGHQNDARYHPDIKFYRAVNKYGVENFEAEIIEKDIVSIGDLVKREVYWIEKLDTYNSGYNSTEGGEVSPMMYPEIREKVSKANKGRVFTEEHKRAISEAKKGVPGCLHTEEHKKYMSEIMSGRKKSPEHIEKIRQANLGKKQSKETVEKRMKHIRGVKKSPEHTKKLAKILSENQFYAKGKDSPLAVSVEQLDLGTGEVLNVFDTMGEAAEHLGKKRNARSGISRCANGKANSAYGYKWRKSEGLK